LVAKIRGKEEGASIVLIFLNQFYAQAFSITIVSQIRDSCQAKYSLSIAHFHKKIGFLPRL
jgi:hypothetical protein